MTDSDDVLRTSLQNAQTALEKGRAPDFDVAWSAAESRARTAHNRRRVLTGSVAAAAAVMLAVGLLRPTEHEWLYVDSDELLETTSWSAPSDSLLPVHQFDIYQEIPVLIESTVNYGGALL